MVIIAAAVEWIIYGIKTLTQQCVLFWF